MRESAAGAWDAVSSGMAKAGDLASAAWDKAKSLGSGLWESIKTATSGAMDHLEMGLGIKPNVPRAPDQIQPLMLTPQVDTRLIPAVFQALLMLTPMLATAMPVSAPLNMPTVATSLMPNIGPVEVAGEVTRPFEPSPLLARQDRQSLGSDPSGMSSSQESLRPLIETLIAKIDALAERPIDLSVTTKIDGRQVAQSVYKDMRERKIRNYETL